MDDSQRLVLALSGLFLLGTSAQWIAAWLRLPSILFLLAFGFLAGPVSDLLWPGSALIRPDQDFGALLFPVVSLSVAVILFEGSLKLRWRELRDIGGVLLALLTVGALVTWLLTATIAHFVLGFNWTTAVLLGAILVVTGPTVIGPLLRQIRPIGRVGPIARWEGIVIDPIGAVLAVLVFEAGVAIQEAGLEQATWAASTGLLKTIAAGGLIGTCTALLLALLLRRHAIPDHLESSVSLMAVLGAFTGANLIQHESGLVAVTVMGVLLANRRGLDLHHIEEFNENLSMLLISTLFILLSARIDLGELVTLGPRGGWFLLAMLFLVRPLAVWLSTLRSRLTWQEKIFLGWFAPRGIVAAAVSSVFALRMADDGNKLVTATFLVIVGTVVVYGFTAFPLARRLGLAKADPQGVLIAGANAGARAIAHALQQAGFPVLLVDTNPWNIQSARMEGLPTRHGNILTEELLDRLDLGGIGRFIALTPNDEVNALAALHLRGLFGRAEVYQLPPRQRTERSETPPQRVRTRFLFGPEVTSRYLDDRFAGGAIIKTTRLTREFDFDDFVETHGASAIPLFVVSESGRLRPCVSTNQLLPKPGQTVIALTDPLPAEEQPPAHSSE